MFSNVKYSLIRIIYLQLFSCFVISHTVHDLGSTWFPKPSQSLEKKPLLIGKHFTEALIRAIDCNLFQSK